MVTVTAVTEYGYGRKPYSHGYNIRTGYVYEMFREIF